VSRIITGKLEIETLPVLVPQLLDTALAGVLPEAVARQVSLVRLVPDDLPPIEGDPKRLQQVLGNVLANAVKFTPENGEVEIRCGADIDTVTIEVRDSGIGIAPEFLPYVFDRFRQGDSRASRRFGGLGLGLAIARHLVEQHGGRIQASSEGPGQGTTITIRLPIGARTHVPAPSSRSWAPVSSRPLDGRRVLVVDDQADARELLAVMLQHSGADVRQCASAAEALECCRTSEVDLLVSDIAMPGVDGHELIGRLRTLRADLPAVAVSAYARPEDRYTALAAGYNAYCAKPVEASDLLRVIEGVLAS
jgi:CheY-like chemotaxis protein